MQKLSYNENCFKRECITRLKQFFIDLSESGRHHPLDIPLELEVG